ncbi:hypothetical protein DSO57_1016089 [Entomophthora muscae]|uniref:Uncharacterized protein n=1 Tax=Entomophthora muscae TaxID=34485 RepID=A0ACC2RW75_9FUNG|nr:hypothetical protein DSO57_1016089 [Entomophthora muscae]
MRYSESLNTAVRDAVQKWGCVVTASAGNKNVDACSKSPASAPTAITVGATDQTDSRADFSNWGKCLTLFAPGDKIHSTSIEDGECEKSGTSMAAPHVAGLAANVMSKTGKYNPDDVLKEIIDHSQPDVAKKHLKKSPNFLASNIFLNSFDVEN